MSTADAKKSFVAKSLNEVHDWLKLVLSSFEVERALVAHTLATRNARTRFLATDKIHAEDSFSHHEVYDVLLDRRSEWLDGQIKAVKHSLECNEADIERDRVLKARFQRDAFPAIVVTSASASAAAPQSSYARQGFHQMYVPTDGEVVEIDGDSSDEEIDPAPFQRQFVRVTRARSRTPSVERPSKKHLPNRVSPVDRVRAEVMDSKKAPMDD
jgi:hypothetical protein